MPEIRERKQGEKLKGKGGTPAAGKDLRQQMTAKFRRELVEKAQNRDADYSETPETEAAEQVQDAALTTGREIKNFSANTISRVVRNSKEGKEKTKAERQRQEMPHPEAPAGDTRPSSNPSRPPAQERMIHNATEDLREKHIDPRQEQTAPKERPVTEATRERPIQRGAEHREPSQPAMPPARERMRQTAVTNTWNKTIKADLEPPKPKERPADTVIREKAPRDFTSQPDASARIPAKQQKQQIRDVRFQPTPAEIRRETPAPKERPPKTIPRKKQEQSLISKSDPPTAPPEQSPMPHPPAKDYRARQAEANRDAPLPKERPAASIIREKPKESFTPLDTAPAAPSPRERMQKSSAKNIQPKPVEIRERSFSPKEQAAPLPEAPPVEAKAPEIKQNHTLPKELPRVEYAETPEPVKIRTQEPTPATIRDIPAPPQPQERMRQNVIKEKQIAIRQRQPAQQRTPQQKQQTALPVANGKKESTLPAESNIPPGKRMLESARSRSTEARQQLPPSAPKQPENAPAPLHITEQNITPLENQSINPSIKERPRRGISPKEKQAGGAFVPKPRQNAVIQTRTAKQATPIAAARGKGAGPQIMEKARRRVQKNAQHKMLQNSKKTAKVAGTLTKKAVEITAKAAKALISALAGLLGGGLLIPVIIVVILVAAIIASPFGILFSNEPTPNAMPLNIAIGQIRREFSNKLEELQDGEYDDIQIEGQPPDWREVVAVFAAKTAGADDGLDVAALTPDRVELLRAVFWDMCVVTSEVETTEYPDSDPDDEVDDSYTESVLKITITAKTAEDMRTEYSFNDNQNSALTELLAELATMEILVTDLTASEEQAREVKKNLPDDLAPERRAVVETACELVGKVTYFWGGKSLVIGWDNRWGIVTKVTAPDSPTTGTYRPYGLDCSGFVDWVFYNATDGAYYPGHGGGTNSQLADSTQISWSEAQPGDLVFYSDVSHVGIVGVRDADGNLLIIHCTSGSINGTTITGAGGFGIVARPSYFNS